MNRIRIEKYIKMSIALFVVAMLVLSCDKPVPPPAISDPQTMPTMVSYNLTTMESQDGVRTYRFETPLMEKFGEAAEPYTEFKKGVKVEKFGSDSITIESDLVADYAHYNETQKLWEARGNVVARNLKEDKVLYTEQLFWDEVRKKIYTDKPAKVIDRGNVHHGIGFETDEKFEEWQFNRARGQIEVENPKDSTARDSVSVSSSADSVSGNGSSESSTPNGTTTAKPKPVVDGSNVRNNEPTRGNGSAQKQDAMAIISKNSADSTK